MGRSDRPRTVFRHTIEATRKSVFIIPIIVTLLTIGLMIYVGFTKDLWAREANEIGDFLAGFMSFIGVIWIITTMGMQSKELRLQREELTENRRANRDQADVQRLQLRQGSIDTIAKMVRSLANDIKEGYTGVYDVLIRTGQETVSALTASEERSSGRAAALAQRIWIMTEEFSNAIHSFDLNTETIKAHESSRVTDVDLKVEYPEGVEVQDFHSLRSNKDSISGIFLAEINDTHKGEDWRDFRNVFVLIEGMFIKDLSELHEVDRLLHIYDIAESVGLVNFMTGELERAGFRDASVLVMVLEAYRNSPSAARM